MARRSRAKGGIWAPEQNKAVGPGCAPGRNSLKTCRPGDCAEPGECLKSEGDKRRENKERDQLDYIYC